MKCYRYMPEYVLRKDGLAYLSIVNLSIGKGKKICNLPNGRYTMKFKFI